MKEDKACAFSAVVFVVDAVVEAGGSLDERFF
jgi:hypothetical protein